jgi:hypothetical protein
VILEWLEFRPQMEELFNFDYFHNWKFEVKNLNDDKIGC